MWRWQTAPSATKSYSGACFADNSANDIEGNEVAAKLGSDIGRQVFHDLA